MFTALVWDDFWILVWSPTLQPLYKCVLLPTAVLCYKHTFFSLHSAAKHHFGCIGVVHISMVHLTLYSKHSYAWEYHLTEVLRQPAEQTISVYSLFNTSNRHLQWMPRGIFEVKTFISGLWYFLALLLHPVSCSLSRIWAQMTAMVGVGVRVDFSAVLLIAHWSSVVPRDGLWLELCAC